MIFRLMEEKDLLQVCQIEKSAFASPWSYESFLSSLKNQNNIYLVAEENEEVTGYCGVWCIAGEGQINNIAVKEGWRHKGIGYGLLTYLFQIGREKLIESYTLEVRQSNHKAISLYRKAGFQTAGIRKNFYRRPAEDGIIMTAPPLITSMNGLTEPI